MRVGWIVVVALLMNAAVAGCFGSKKDKEPSSDVVLAAVVPPVLTLTVKVGNDTYSYTTAKAAGNATNATASHGTSSATGGNATSNATGNATGASCSGNLTNCTLANATPASPTGLAPLNVSFSFAVLNGPSHYNWTFNPGDVATVAPSTHGGNASANATGNGTSASSSSTTPSGNGTGNATANGTNAAPTSALLSGSAPNATYLHTYVLAGNYTATFTVALSNASKLTLTAPIRVLAAGNASNATAALAPGTLLLNETLGYTGTILVGTQGAISPAPSGCGLAHQGDVKTHAWKLNATDANGTAMAVSKVFAHLDLGTTNIDSDFFLKYASNGTVIASSTNFNEPVAGSGSPTEEFTYTGLLPAGDYVFEVDGCTAAEGSYTITGYALHVAT